MSTLDNLQETIMSLYDIAKPIPNYITAILKILYDKSKDMITSSDEELIDTLDYELTDKKMENIIRDNLSKFQDEKNNKFTYGIYYTDNVYNACCYYTLQKYKIGLIINVTREMCNYYPEYFEYDNMPIRDNNKDSIKPYLDGLYDKITDFKKRKPDKKILVHCVRGASRSVIVVTSYIMDKHVAEKTPITFEHALEFVRSKRNIANPSFKLAKDLIKKSNDVN